MKKSVAFCSVLQGTFHTIFDQCSALHVRLLTPFFLDIDECQSFGLSSEYQHLSHICHDDANCSNTKGSYYCICLEGYSGNGQDCDGNAFSRTS